MRYQKQLIVAALILTMTMGTLGCAIKEDKTLQANVEAAQEEKNEEKKEEGSFAVQAEGTEPKKEETVYVKANADGMVKEIVVSDILRNGNQTEILNDRSDLSGIKNIKGKEAFQKREDGSLVWQADGNDIYYQGKTKKTLPVEVKVTYYLEGEEIKPEKLAGKSGNIRIRFDYINHETQTVTISGEERTIYTPFLAVTGLFLDEERFVNVEMENGRVISDGSRIMAGGMAMPGLSESIALAEVEDMEDLDIPEYLELSAYTTDFALPLTMTAVTSDFAEEIDLDELDSYEDLKADMQELKDASVELVDGTHELVDGVVELKDGSVELYDGAVELDDGALELDDGAKELYDGAVKLDDGAYDLRDGALELKNALKTYNAGLDTLTAAMSNADGNGHDITVVANQLSAGVNQVVDSVMASTLSMVNANLAELSQFGIGPFESVDAFLAFDLQSVSGELMGQLGGGSVSGGNMEQIAGMLQEADQKIKAAQAEVRTTYTQLMTLKEGMEGLSGGISQVYGGITTQLKPGAEKILDGARELYDGTKELKDGTEELLDGTVELKDGTTELKDGTVELLDGTVELKDGVQELYDGSIELRDGMEEFDEDGIQKLYDMVCKDLQKVIDRARAVVDAGEAYQTFTQLAPGMKGSVKFLIETEAIE